MNLQAIKSEIVEILNNTEDENLIATYRDILISLLKYTDKTVIGHSTRGEPLSATLLKKEILEAQTRVKSGKYISHQDVKNKL